jgi:hypothetical protein
MDVRRALHAFKWDASAHFADVSGGRQNNFIFPLDKYCQAFCIARAERDEKSPADIISLSLVRSLALQSSKRFIAH